jgi:hypothetical protein
VSTSIAILKVLSSHPEGRASFESLKADLAILATPEWDARIRALGRRAGTVNIFSQKLATRGADGWAITPTGREFLDRLESGEVFAPPQVSERPALRIVASKPATETINVLKRAWLKVVA